MPTGPHVHDGARLDAVAADFDARRSAPLDEDVRDLASRLDARAGRPRLADELLEYLRRVEIPLVGEGERSGRRSRGEPELFQFVALQQSRSDAERVEFGRGLSAVVESVSALCGVQAADARELGPLLDESPVGVPRPRSELVGRPVGSGLVPDEHRNRRRRRSAAQTIALVQGDRNACL